MCVTGSWGQARLGWPFYFPHLPLNTLFVVLKMPTHHYGTFSGVFWRGEVKWWPTTWEVQGRRSSTLSVFVRAPFCPGPLPWVSPLSYQAAAHAQSPCAHMQCTHTRLHARIHNTDTHTCVCAYTCALYPCPHYTHAFIHTHTHVAHGSRSMEWFGRSLVGGMYVRTC